MTSWPETWVWKNNTPENIFLNIYIHTHSFLKVCIEIHNQMEGLSVDSVSHIVYKPTAHYDAHPQQNVDSGTSSMKVMLPPSG